MGESFFTRFSTLAADLEGDECPDETDLTVGVLATEHVEAEFEMESGLTAHIGDSDGILELSQLQTAAQGGLPDVAQLAYVEELPGELGAKVTVIPVPQAGLDGVNGGVVLLGHDVLAAPAPGEENHLFRDFPSGPPVALPDDLRSFVRLRPAQLVDPVLRFAIALDGLEQSSAYDGLLPLVQDQRVGDLLAYGDALRSGLLEVVSSGGVPTFTTIQELLATLNAESDTTLTAVYDS